MKRDICVCVMLLVLMMAVGYSLLSATSTVPVIKLPPVERLYVSMYKLRNEYLEARNHELYLQEIYNADER